MTLYYRGIYLNSYVGNIHIEQMLSDCGELCGFFIGDLNEDNILDILDIIITVNIVLVGTSNLYQTWSGDINQDNFIDILDVVLLVNLVLS